MRFADTSWVCRDNKLKIRGSHTALLGLDQRPRLIQSLDLSYLILSRLHSREASDVSASNAHLLSSS